jgi:lipid A 3-O-deacylase
MKAPWWILVLLAILSILPARPAAAAPAELALSAGEHNVLDGGDGSEAGIEIRFAPQRFHVWPTFIPDPVPVAGVMVTSKSLAYGYAGFRLNFPAGIRWVVTPGFAAGVFRQGNGRDLGGPVEFRSSIEVAYRLAGPSRLGVAFYHLSNAGLYSHNPGSESLVLSWAVDVDWH